MRDLPNSLGFFGDARLDEGGALLLEGMTREESCCLRRAANGERNKIVRFNELMDNDRVSKEAIIEGWGAATAVAAAGRDVLAIQDTSEIKFNRPAQRQSLGQVGHGNVRGALLHAMIAVDADDGLLIGLVGGDVYTRKGKRTVDHTARSLDDKESRRWIDASEQAAEVLSEARRVTVVADRESDFYPNHVLTRQMGLHILSRSYRDRRLAGGGSLYGTVGHWTPADHAALEIEAKPGRPARTATVELRFGPARLARPDRAEAGMPEALDVHVVELDPEHVEPAVSQLRPRRRRAGDRDAYLCRERLVPLGLVQVHHPDAHRIGSISICFGASPLAGAQVHEASRRGHVGRASTGAGGLQAAALRMELACF